MIISAVKHIVKASWCSKRIRIKELEEESYRKSSSQLPKPPEFEESLVSQYISDNLETQGLEDTCYALLKTMLEDTQNAHLVEQPEKLKEKMIALLSRELTLHPNHLEPIIPIIIDHYLEYRK